MNITKWGRLALLSLVFLACSQEKPSSQKIFDFDGFIDTQVDELDHRKKTLHKTASMDDHSSDSIFVPSSKGWKTELEIFHQLEILNKPSYKNAYLVEDPLKDTNSNLQVRQYSLAAANNNKAPVTMVRFYYHNDFNRLKKIEATLKNENVLYLNHQKLVMEFEDENNKPVLTSYSMVGFQKMMLSDTVHFSVQGTVNQ